MRPRQKSRVPGGVAHVEAVEPRRLFAAAIVADRSMTYIDPTHLAAGADLLYFSATSPGAGRELWASDGTVEGTRMVIDLAGGARDASPERLTTAGNVVYFVANGLRGPALYRSEGTAATTTRLITSRRADDFANFEVAADGSLYFQLREGSGYGLWRSDGVATGTVRLAANVSKSPFVSVAADGRFVGLPSRGSSSVLLSDGTAKGTRPFELKGYRIAVAVAKGDHLYVSTVDDALTTADIWTIGPDDAARRISTGSSATGLVAAPSGRSAWGFTTTDDPTPTEKQSGEIAYPQYRPVRLVDGKATRVEVQLKDKRKATLELRQTALALTSTQDYLLVGGEYGGSEFTRFDAKTNRFVSGGYQSFRAPHGTGSEASSWFNDYVNLERIGDSFFFVGDRPAAAVDDDAAPVVRRGFYEFIPTTGESWLINTVDAPADSATNRGFATSKGLFYTRVGEGGGVELCVARPGSKGKERVVSPTIYGGPGDGQVLAHAPMIGARELLVRRPTPASQLVVELVDGDGRVTTIGTLGEIDDQDRRYNAADVRVSADGKDAFILANDTGDNGESQLVHLRVGGSHSPRITRVIRLYRNSVFLASRDRWATIGELVRASGTTQVQPRSANVDDALNVSRFDGLSGASSHARAIGATPAFAISRAGERTLVNLNGDAWVDVDEARARDGTPLPGLLGVVPGPGAANYLHAAASAYRQVGIYADVRFTAKQLGASSIVSLRSDWTETWLYATVVDADGRWRIVRCAAADDAADAPTTFLAQPDGWTLGAPRIWAARGDDLVLVADQTSSKAATRTHAFAVVGKTFGPRVDDVAADALTIGGDSMFLRTSPTTLARIRGVATRSIDVPADAVDLTAGPAGLSFIASTPATGREAFRYRLDTVVTGSVFNDADGDGSADAADAGERGLAGRRVFIDRDGDGRWSADELDVLTDATGRFEFFELDPGKYKVAVDVPAGQRATTAAAASVRLTPGQRVVKRFGLRAIP